MRVWPPISDGDSRVGCKPWLGGPSPIEPENYHSTFQCLDGQNNVCRRILDIEDSITSTLLECGKVSLNGKLDSHSTNSYLICCSCLTKVL